MISTIMELQKWSKKSESIVMVEYHGIDCDLTNILFLGEKGTFIWGEHSWGVANAWDHPYVTSETLPTPLLNIASMSKQPPETLAKSAKKLQNLSLTREYRAEQFPNDFYASLVS